MRPLSNCLRLLAAHFSDNNNVGLHFNFHVKLLWHIHNVFLYSHDTLSRKFCFLFTLGATETAFFWKLLQKWP